jgi:glutamate synthase domain-containing protein 2/glutamate synthase domain-containing protein 1/glutamate synthase domain-containing protein 3
MHADRNRPDADTRSRGSQDGDTPGVAGSVSVEPMHPVPAPLYDPRREHDACGVGFVASPDGRHADRTVPMALEALVRLAHRGARGADDTTGDGAGLSIPVSASLRNRILREAGVSPGPRRRVAIGMCFLPPGATDEAVALIERRARVAGLLVAGWRDVPVDASLVTGRRIGETPVIRQAVLLAQRRQPGPAFARSLALVRRSVEAEAALRGLDGLVISSLSDAVVVYKGLFVGDELGRFYADLRAEDLDARYALFHQRYSTNTFPSWRLAQPFGYLAHNGEINTVRANREAMRGRRADLGGGAWARRLAAVAPLVSVDGSDSQSLDDALELLLLAGMRLDAAIATLVPGAEGLGADPEPLPARVEPWDGPAALVFGDGRLVGARLDRNGLRPLAMTATGDGLIVVSSEAGSVELAPERVVSRHRLGPGEMVVVDTLAGTVTGPTARALPAATTVAPPPVPLGRSEPAAATGPQQRVALGLDAEIVRQLVKPMATDGHEAIWSMGDDTPIAPLATRPRRVTAFLRQAFAQVTNPAIDPERERVVMSFRLAVGRQPSLLGGDGATAVTIDGPVLDACAWRALRDGFGPGRVVVLDATWSVGRGPRGLAFALDRLARQALAASRRGATLVVLSDFAAGPRRIAIPPVLAVGRLHAELVAAGRRSRTDLAIEAGECFDVHDVAMLIAAGASAVHPWLLLELAAEQAGGRGVEHLTPDAGRANVVAGLEAGLRKVLSRMGISTLASYRGGQLFDTIGLERGLVASCFPAAGSWPGSVGLDAIGRELVARHRRAWRGEPPALEDPGLVRFRGSGEAHAFAPKVVKVTQVLAATDDQAAALAEYRATVTAAGPRQPRDLLSIRPAGQTLALSEVEPASSIVRRFVSSAMSLGALSPEAHQAISIGMARLGGSANSGEGGEDAAWYVPSADGDRRDAAIKQVASARFGVTAEYLARADQLEIKIAQGSKPGEGGQLPGRKATAFIAALRRGRPGMTMISPPPHHDIYSIEDLAQLIGDLRALNPEARIGVKLVAGAGIGTIAAGVAKAQADYVMVSGHSGGTGASPLSSIKHAGLPWELGLAEVHQVLVRNRLRDRVSLRTDGGLQTGRDVVVAALLGAEEFGFGTAALVAIGCDMARQCHLDTCPTGIATQREDLRAKFTGTPEQVVAFFTAVAEDVRHELAALSARSIGEVVGRSDLLEAVPGASLDLAVLARAPRWRPASADAPKDRPLWGPRPVSGAWEAQLAGGIAARVERGRAVTVRRAVTPSDRSIGARLAGALSRRPEPRRLPHVAYELTGSAGQSLGAFAVAGMRITVRGEANDYVGKGLSGGTVVVRPADESGVTAGGQALVGNVCLFGATGGVLHVVGQAGMRFAVRNSGARAVVEGIGAHGCEYMTGGTVVVLGEIGSNFGAGMTGGRAFLTAMPGIQERLHAASVAVRAVADDDELRTVHEMVIAHAEEGSAVAAALLRDWRRERFLVVEPREEPAISLPIESTTAAAH